MPNHASYKHDLHWLGTNYPDKATCEISASSFEDFLSKGGKSAKTHTYA